MARIETWFKCNLKAPVIVHKMETGLFSQDALGNLIGVEVYDNNGPVNLSGSLTGYCVLADGSTIPVAGTRMTSTGNKHKAYIILPQNAYSVPGIIQISLKLTDGNAITTLACCVGYMMQSRTPNQVSPSSQTITDWTNQITSTMQRVYDDYGDLENRIDAVIAAISAQLIEDNNYRIILK